MYGEFYELEVWKKSRDFRKDISALVKRLPPFETNKLADQLTRAARSVTTNIAESHGRLHKKECAQFNRHSRGSLKEVLDHLYCALDEGYITESEFAVFKVNYERCLKLLNGYINYINSRPSTTQSVTRASSATRTN